MTAEEVTFNWNLAVKGIKRDPVVLLKPPLVWDDWEKPVNVEHINVSKITKHTA